MIWMSNLFVFIAFEAFSLAWSFCFPKERERKVGCYDTYGFFSFGEEKRECIEEG